MKRATFAKLVVIAGILAVAAWGCKHEGSDSGASDSGGNPPSDSGGNPPSDSGGQVECTDLGTLDTTSETVYGGASTGGQYDWMAVMTLNADANPDILFFELYGDFSSPPGLTTGTHTLGTGVEADYATCAYCVLIGEDCSPTTGECAKDFFATSGTLELTALGQENAGNLTGTLTNAHVVEVTIDTSYHSTPVPGGDCYDIDSYSFDTAVVPFPGS